LVVVDHHKLWLLIGLAGVVAVATTGILLIPNPGGGPELFGLPRDVRSDLGSALLGGAVIGLAILGLELALSRRVTDLEQRRAKELTDLQAEFARQTERASLRLQLSLLDSLAGVDLNGQDLSGFYLMKKTFVGANLENVNLSSATLRQSHFDGAQMYRANLSAANAFNTTFENTRLGGANFIGAQLIKARFIQADLKRADFRDANLQEAVFRHSYVTRADFRNAILLGSDFREVSIPSPHSSIGTRFDGAAVDARTKWPDDYAPWSTRDCDDDHSCRVGSNTPHLHILE
jgi:uncharacterized protein YjbI with pentapeptide repeats